MSASLQLDENTLRAVVDEVLRGLGRNAPAIASAPPAAPAATPVRSRADGRFGIFPDAPSACAERTAVPSRLHRRVRTRGDRRPSNRQHKGL